VIVQDHESNWAAAKIAIAWIGVTFGSITLSQLAICSTIVFTVLQTFFLLRDKWWRERKAKAKE
jgi:hypothetical protein